MSRLDPVFALLLGIGQAGAASNDWFGIRAVDAESGRPVPLVELETVNHRLFVTDNGGWAAFGEPGLLGRRVWFNVRSHGYEFPADGFSLRGLALDTKPGGRTEIRLPRRNTAERIARLTGEGCWRDSALLGEPVPAGASSPLLNAEVLGQDSVQTALLGDRRYWFWGDTLRAAYPLGHFLTAGATTAATFNPEVGITFDYFTRPDGFSRGVAPATGPGMVWLDGVLSVRDGPDGEALLAHYSRMKSLGERLEHGLAVWNARSNAFEKLLELPGAETWRHPAGHPTLVRRDGQEWFYFAQPFCTVRVPAQWNALRDTARYEAWTASPQGPRWTSDGPPAAAKDLELPDAQGHTVRLHAGSVAWNEWARQWLMIAVESGGKSSFLGDVWVAAAPAPEGPWRLVREVVTHNRYSFYNPVHHPFLDREGGRVIYFEGTYAETFSGAAAPTPGADYNQVLYRLDLAATGLAKPD